MPDSDKLTQQRERKEAQIEQAETYILRSLHIPQMKQILQSLRVEWANDFEQERQTALTAQLKDLGVYVRVAHYTGDSSFPTEYTISDGVTLAIGPTFDLALMEYIKRVSSGQRSPHLLSGEKQ